MSDEIVITDTLDEVRELLHNAPDASSLCEIGLSMIVRGEGAARAVVETLEKMNVVRGARVTVLSDAVAKRYGDSDVLDVVLNELGAAFRADVVKVIASFPNSLVLADEATVAGAISDVARHAPQALVSVGSGTVVDIGKVAARELSLVHVVVQTAASVNGFSDGHSVLLVKGVKRTTPSRWPDALIIDPCVLARAPLAMARSGLGDQLSMFSAAADWYLSDAVGFDVSFSPTVVALMRRSFVGLGSSLREVGEGSSDAVTSLASCLAVGGIAMGVAGRTAPSSGTEHLISHLLEMYADASGTPSASHGSQVGVSSVFAMLLWRHVRDHLTTGVRQVSGINIASRERVLETFAHLDTTGALAEECWTAYERKARWMSAHLGDVQRVVSEWSAHDVVVEDLLGPVGDVSAMLRDAQAPLSFSQLEPAPPQDVVAWSIANGHLMRDRFTIIDLAVLVGFWTPDNIAAIMKELDDLAS
ncbi:MAG: iron-containing alcohol dehydrogenase [Acidimicrobiales bacterium]